KPLSLSLLRCAAFCRLKIFQYFFEIVLYRPLPLSRLIHVSARDQLLILSYLIRDPVFPYRIASVATLASTLLLVRTPPARRLIDIAFETGNVIRKRLLAFAELLFLLRVFGFPSASEIIHAG